MNENHTSHVAGGEMRVFRTGLGGPALGSYEAIALQLIGELLNGGRLKAGENEGSFDGLKSGAGREAGAGSGFTGECKLLRAGLGRGILRWRTQDVLDGCDAGKGLFGEDTELERQRTGELAFEIDGAAAHAGDDASVLHLGAFELDEDDGLLRAEKIVEDAEDFEIEFFDLVAGEDGVGVALHAGADLIERQDFARFLRVGHAGAGPEKGDECAESEREQ